MNVKLLKKHFLKWTQKYEIKLKSHYSVNTIYINITLYII